MRRNADRIKRPQKRTTVVPVLVSMEQPAEIEEPENIQEPVDMIHLQDMNQS